MAIKRAFGTTTREPRPQVMPSSHLHRIIACEDRLEEAVHFLVHALEDKPRKGKKPVVLHSLRVAWWLVGQGFDADVVVAGLLHDVLEKTSLTSGQIARHFGPEVATMVAAATNDERQGDALSRYEDSLRRCAAYGPGALAVRVADLIDNCDRLMALDTRVRLERIAEKLRMLLRVGREEALGEPLLEELARRLRRINRKVAGLALVPKKHPALAKAARFSSRHK
jgi:(p)ppGpp synthase/HD superfamily hydrolase